MQDQPNATTAACQREDVSDLVALTEQLTDHEVDLALLVTASITQRRGLTGPNVDTARRLLAT